MRLVCTFAGHDWSNDCERCARCGNTRRLPHDWTKDCEKCARCSHVRMGAHDWSRNCEKCWVCGRTRTGAHDWRRDCQRCSRCSAANPKAGKAHRWYDGKCAACGVRSPEEKDVDEGGNTPLHRAAAKADVHFLLKDLLENGADVNRRNGDGNTALHVAAGAGEGHWQRINLCVSLRGFEHYEMDHAPMVKTLLEWGADVNAVNKRGETPLQVANEVLRYYVNVPVYDPQKLLGTVQNLLRQAMDLSRRSKQLAKRQNSAKETLAHGSNGAAAGDPESNLKRWKLSSEPEEWVEEHLHGWNHNDWLGLLTSLHRTEHWPMEEAAIGQHLEMLRYKLTATKEGDCPLHKAARNGHKEMVELLLANGFSVHNYHAVYKIPLNEAARNGHKEVVQLLLAKGSQISHAGCESPLHEAASYGHADVVQLLLANKAAVNARFRGRTPLHNAAEDGHPDVVKLLLAHGADANAEDDRGWTPYTCAAHNDNLQSRGPAEAARLQEVKKVLGPHTHYVRALGG